VRYNANEQEVFLGHAITQHQNVSEATAELIDAEIRRLVETAESSTRKILTEKLEDLHKLAKALLEYETLSGDEVRALLRGEPIVRPSVDEPPPTAKAPGGRRSSVPTAGQAGKDRPEGTLDPQPQPGA
jgi:cell division protease FtsH